MMIRIAAALGCVLAVITHAQRARHAPPCHRDARERGFPVDETTLKVEVTAVRANSVR